jgi:hypothetical protein
MSRFIRVAIAGCFVLGLSLLFSTPAAQAKGGGGHSHGSHGHSHSRGHGRRGRHVGYKHRRRYDRRYWNYGSYGYDDGYGGDAAPVAVSEDCGCAPVADGYDGGSYGEYDGFRHYRHRGYRGRSVSHRGSRGRGGRGGHGRK